MPRLLTVEITDWKNPACARNTGSAGDRICQNGNGERSAKTTAREGRRGSFFRLSTRTAGPTGGAKTESEESAIVTR